METNRDHQFYIQEDGFNVKEFIEKYSKLWPWFLSLMTILLVLGFLYITYTPKNYSSKASIIIEDKDNSRSTSSSGFGDISILSGLSTNSIANEIGLLHSYRLMFNAVKSLNLQVQYWSVEGLIPKELYNNSPIVVNFLALDEQGLNGALKEGANQFVVQFEEDDSVLVFNEITGFKKAINFGSSFNIGFAEVIIEKNLDYKLTQESSEESSEESIADIELRFVSLKGIAQAYQQKLSVEIVEKQSTLIELALEDRVSQKGQDILNQLIFEYNKEAIEDKRLIAQYTADFINDRLSIINQELDSVESGKEQFKRSNQLTDLSTQSSSMIQNVNEYNRSRQAVENELEVTNLMLDYLGKNGNDLLPSNLGFTEASVAGFIGDYNKLVIERNRLADASTERNPMVLNLDTQINQLREGIQSSLSTQREKLEVTKNSLRKKVGMIGGQIAMMPEQERQVRGIERQQNIKEALYLFLLQKREENTLELSVNAPKAKIVDKAYSSSSDIKPSPKIILAMAFLMAFLIPIGLVEVKGILNDKIMDRGFFKSKEEFGPLLGEIPNVSKRNGKVIKVFDRSVLAEAFRILSSNLRYMNLDQENESSTVLFVTSSIQGEGKTFVSANMAVTKSLSGKNVLLIGADLRNPKLDEVFPELHKQRGLSDYLTYSKYQLNQLLVKSTEYDNLTFLPSGSIPPNPSEILQSKKMSELFQKLKKSFDYIIVDTAPSVLVADTFLINHLADSTLYVMRSGFTTKKLFEFVEESRKSKKLNNVGFVLNDVKENKLGYAGQYGYAND